MEPFLAIGEILKERGQQVVCAFPEQFRKLAEDANVEFASLGADYIEMLDSDVGKAALGGGGSGLTQFIANLKLGQFQTDINKALIHRQHEIIESEKPDRVLYNGKAIYPIIWGLENEGKNILICPLPYMHYVRNHSHVAFNRNLGPFLNKRTYALADFGLTMTLRMSAKWLNISQYVTRTKLSAALRSNKAIYTISPALFSRPDYWHENLQVLGFHERCKTTNWQPDIDLVEFLEKHKNNRILLITFGSMTNPEPEEKTKIIIEILERNKIRAIINTASGGIIKPDHYDAEQIHFAFQIPYDWIFPKVYGVVHHGGSGTTHLGLKYGCATLIIPHIIDQFVWNRIVDQLGVGPKGIKIGKMTTKDLEPHMLQLVNNPSYKKKAQQIAGQMEKEDFREAIYQAIIDE
jgi:UDP:flavonoid glycosyltransferase YjiC (YdhE family)